MESALHNLVLELMISYGIPAAFFTIAPIISLVYLSCKNILRKKLSKYFLFDKSLVISLLVILVMHMVDIQYFDGRFSIIFWLLIASMKNTLNKNKKAFFNN